MRKVKYTQDTFDEKLGKIISEFPVLDVSWPGSGSSSIAHVAEPSPFPQLSPQRPV